jgi:hypothetical protein
MTAPYRLLRSGGVLGTPIATGAHGRRLASAAAALLLATAAWGQAPQVGTVAPLNGSAVPGTNGTLTFTATYPSSTTLPELDTIMSNTGSGTDGCFFVYFQNPSTTSVPTLYLFDDNVQNWYPVRLGTSDTASNSQCQINGTSSSSSYSSGALSVSVDVIFSSSWQGATLELYEQAVDDTSTSTSGWWQIPESSFSVLGPSQGPPQLGTVNPTNGSSPPYNNTITQFTASDPNGWAALNEMDIQISANGEGTNACSLVFFPYLNTVYLFSDDLSSWMPAGLGSYDVAYNSQCQVIGNQSTYAGVNSTTADLALELAFFPPFVGTNYFGEYIVDQLGGTAGWGTVPGTITVVGPPIITMSSYLNFGAVSSTYSTTLTEQGGSAPLIERDLRGARRL